MKMDRNNILKRTLICNICQYCMDIYYKDFSIVLYFCPFCFHFAGDILNSDCTNIFKDYNLFKLEVTMSLFNVVFRKTQSYMIDDNYNIHSELKKILKIVNRKKERDTTTVYIKCKSYDNIKNSKVGLCDFYSTNSMKYLASKYNIHLNSIYLLKELNETIYEFVLTEQNLNLYYICDILYKEIEKDLYKIDN